jgi:hypothetical protein
MGTIRKAPQTRRESSDKVRLKYRSSELDPTAGVPAHINPREDDYLKRVLPEAAGKVVTSGLLAEAGRYGDDRVTKLTLKERALLKRRGGSGTRNPASGLLEFEDDAGNGNPGGGHNGDTGPGSAGMGGPGASSSPGGGPSAPGTGYGPARDVGYAWGNAPTSYRSPDDPYTGAMPSIESLLNTPDGYRAKGFEDISMTQYSPPDTFGRLLDTYLYGPPPSYTARGQVPGNLGTPTGLGPGIVGKAVTNFGGPMMSAAMNLGMHFDQAMSPGTRAASMAANQEQGAKNSTGQDNDTVTGLSLAELERNTPGARSNAATIAAPVAPAGYTINPAGQIVPQRGGKNRPAHQDAIENLLYDYIWRGPSGRGWA